MAQTGRAELLLALHLGAGDSVALEHDDQHWWGYRREPKAEPQPEPEPVPPVIVLPKPGLEPDPKASDDSLRLPLQMPLAWVLIEQTSRDLPKELEGLPKLTGADLRALAPEPLPYRDLVPWARALPGLRRHTDRQAAGAVDWPRLANNLARRETPRRLPRRAWQRWPHQMTLVLDFSPRLDPYRWDFHRLALQLYAQLPAASLSVRLLRHGPAGPWQAWPHPRKPAPPADLHDWEAHHAPGTVMLFATDLGLFDEQPASHRAWLDWGDALRAQGCRLIALAPLSPHQPTAQALQRFELLRWSPDSRWRRERRAADPAAREPSAGADSLDAMVALAATALRIDPPLLRAWRSLLPAGNDAGLEGRLWNHPHLQTAGLTCATRAEHLEAHLARHAALPSALRQAARAVHASQHAHLRRSLGCAEALRWHAAVRLEGVPEGTATAGQDEPLGFVKRLLHSVYDDAALPDRTLHRSLMGAAELIQAAASQRVRALDLALYAALDAAVARWRAGLGGAAPGATDTAAVRQWMLVQQGPALALLPADAAGPGQALGEPVQVPVSAQEAWLQSPDGSRSLALEEQWAELAQLGDSPERLTVTLDRHSWSLEQVARPGWAAGWRQAEGRVSAGVPLPMAAGLPAGQLAWFQFPLSGQTLHLAGGRATAGLDAYGVYLELSLVTREERSRPVENAEATGFVGGELRDAFRLRWIPPGRFLMGSPEGEGDSDEHPQHPALISQGFWLAEGPCTQALWGAVMGSNPSHFKDGAAARLHPVEQVSFDDVQNFLQRLRDLLPDGCAPALPTEAEWEYAARAGTLTAYPWGDKPDNTRANWDQQHQGTTPVGRFEPNPWGLLDMHGNVWEWCADGPRDYTREAQRDPHGELEGPPRRAVRGGSWLDAPGFARSAFRYVWPPDSPSQLQGFRLALRSSSPGAGGPPAEPAIGPGGVSTGAGRPGGDMGFLERHVSRVRDAFAPARPGQTPKKKKRRG